MDEKSIEQVVAETAKALQDAAAATKLSATADACLIAAATLAANKPATPAKK